jgi:large exoprotein involved in heme utilization and adhesion
MASTANGINLVDAGGRAITFGTNPNGDAPLLTISPNVFFNVSSLNMGGGNGQISNYGTLQTNNPNQYIGLVGGNVTLDGSGGGGKIIAPGGRVDIGGLSGAGTVSVDNNGLVFSSGGIGRSNVLLTDGAGITVRATGILDTVNTFFNNVNAPSSSINISANNLDLLNAGAISGTLPASLDAGLETNSGVQTKAAGDINIDATGKISLNNSAIKNTLRPGAEGSSIGGIKIQAGTLDVNNNSLVSTVTAGKGNAGNVEISTGNLSVTNGAEIAASTFGKGDAGSIKITATGNISFDGLVDGVPSGAFSLLQPGGEGKGGSVEIITQNLSVTNGAEIAASTFGTGDAGTVKITATGNISFDGFGFDGVGNAFPSSALSEVKYEGIGKGGTVEINTRNLSVTNGAELVASTFRQGDAGTVKITATGNISFDGFVNNLPSGAFSSVQPGAVGNSGGVVINTRNLSVTNGARLFAGTEGQGNAGTVKITATENVLFDGFNGFPSGAFSTVEEGGFGKGGGVEITAQNLSVTNGAEVGAFTRGQGSAGIIKITATGNISFDGKKDGGNSGVFSTVEQRGVGKGGGIEITADNLSVTNLATVTTSSKGQGDAGDIFLNANKIILNNPNNAVVDINNGGISSIALSSTGGDINVVAKDYLLLRNNSLIATNSFSTGKDGNGGNITISSPLIIATPGNNDITANADAGNGGKVTIASRGLFNIKDRPKGQESELTNDITANSRLGQNGNVNISTPGTDPGKDSTTLPTVPTDASNQIAQTCSASNRQNKFTVAGRGGMPPNANEPLTSDVVWQDTRATNSQSAANSTTNNPPKYPPPAVGLVFDGKGKAMLVAAATEGQPTGTNATCPQAKEDFRIRDQAREDFRIRD